jgi:hypothetical protein
MVTLTLAVTGALAQEAAKPKAAKDQAEYDLIQAVNKEQPSPKKVELLQQWKQKYADSDYKEERAITLVQTYQALGKAPELWEASKELNAINPKNPMALFFLMQLPLSMNDPSKFAEGETYTKQLLELIPTLKAEDKDKKAQEALARKTLGNLAMAKKDYAKAEQLFTDYLKWNPDSGTVSYSLAQAMLKDKAKQMPALWHLARAAHYSGDDALPDATKKQLQAYFEKTYVAYHGSKKGMQEVLDAALKNPFPPEGWKILNSYEEDEKDMEELKKTDEQMYNWVSFKRNLTGPQSAQFWDALKDTAISTKFKGTVISSNPPVKTKELIVGIRDAGNQEVKIILEAPVGKVEPGTVIEFEGAVAKEFTADPFLLTVEVENDKATGLPKAVGPARVVPKKAAPKKK